IRKNGINAITIRDDDALVDAQITDGNNHIILGTSSGMAIRFHEDDCRNMGRTASGVRGVKLRSKDFVVGMVVVRGSGGTILVAAENGYGKRTSIDDYRLAKRGGIGVITLKTTERNGHMISIMEVGDEDDLMIVTEKGIINRQGVNRISTVGRNTQGVRLIRLDDDDLIAAIERVPKSDEDPGDDNSDDTDGPEPNASAKVNPPKPAADKKVIADENSDDSAEASAIKSGETATPIEEAQDENKAVESVEELAKKEEITEKADNDNPVEKENENKADEKPDKKKKKNDDDDDGGGQLSFF
ncbi:MAG: hypothetical protein KDD94_07525, partial [Calditrichaeota bacterium]|nr:hypothetical protein [Calditrichota bacterium]